MELEFVGANETHPTQSTAKPWCAFIAHETTSTDWTPTGNDNGDGHHTEGNILLGDLTQLIGNLIKATRRNVIHHEGFT
ncbi:hypothetical protein KIN20_031454 [Parelaphostrongylus tenuis]|uniref:Uncharacterized protein n=1 Tax=Parelaphostrongylus tenuis TaxID=148309 RepID=A0AAD5R6P6_PARTN|nr:hypothetical protein KIN20_031454 [Parelaphostrongylus tenuis]